MDNFPLIEYWYPDLVLSKGKRGNEMSTEPSKASKSVSSTASSLFLGVGRQGYLWILILQKDR